MADLAQHNVERWIDMQKGFLQAAGLGSGKSSSRKNQAVGAASRTAETGTPCARGLSRKDLLRRTKNA